VEGLDAPLVLVLVCILAGCDATSRDEHAEQDREHHAFLSTHRVDDNSGTPDVQPPPISAHKLTVLNQWDRAPTLLQRGGEVNRSGGL